MANQLYNKAHTLYATNNQKWVFPVQTLNNLTEEAINIVDCTLYLTVKETKTSVTNLISVNTGVIATIDGTATLEIPKATMDTIQAGSYYYELSILTNLGELNTLTTSDFIVSQKI